MTALGFVALAFFALALLAYGWLLRNAKASVIPAEDAPTRGMVSPALRIGSPFAQPQRISQRFGGNPTRYGKFIYSGVPLQGHNGIDYAVPVGTPVLSVADGVVFKIAFEANGFGHHVLIRHAWGESLYAHLYDASVFYGDTVQEGQQIARSGDTVQEGQQIARSGNSGGSTGPHLHFGVRVNPYTRKDGWGGFSDPLPMLDKGSFSGVV